MALQLAGLADLSNCCGALLRDPEELFGIVAERCDGCGQPAARINPRTGKREWLNGARVDVREDAVDGPAAQPAAARS